MCATGPEGRGIRDGFDVAFEDLADGTLNRLRPAYFDELDRLIDILRGHGIVPVIPPVFQGFGWKGLDAAGRRVAPDQYARYCRYLVARYGSGPVIWLVGADGSGEEPTVESGGETIHACDAYAQPTGIHYAPDARFDSHQSSEWLDFQWCQTGHRGQHHPERLMWMSCQTPSKAVANGEPTYERPGLAAGWWQGHEAWQNLCAGGTMGVVYGAMSLWQWKQCRDEAGHPPWCVSDDHDWEDALGFPGGTHVGRMGRILSRYDLRGCTLDWSQTLGVAVLHRPGELLVVYLASGGNFVLRSRSFPENYAIYDLTRGDQMFDACLRRGQLIVEVPEGPHVAVFADRDHGRHHDH
mgnify:FL=1